MTSFTGTWTLTRFALRRDRLRITIWTIALVGTIAATVPALDELFTTEAERAARASIMRTPTGVIFGGPGYGLDDYQLGPMVVNELLMSLLIALAVMNVLLVVRHTRTEEETGRAELVRAGVTGRRAAGTAAQIVAVLTNALIGVLSAATLISFDLPAADSLAVGLGITLTGLTIAALAGVCAQVVEHARAAIGLAMLGFGVLFMFRVIGDIADQGGNLLSWFSPLAWVFQTRPYVDLRWWPLALHLAVTLLLTVAASALAAHRDIGAGLVPPRPGRGEAAKSLSGSFALHLRLQRGALITWSVATLALGIAFGSLADQIGGLVEDSPEMLDLLGGQAEALTDGYFAAIVLYIAMLAVAATVTSVLRLRTEENTGRTELVLATPTARVRWAGTCLLVALLTAVVTMLAGGIGMGLSAAAILDDPGYLGTLLLATANTLVVPVLFGAVAALLYGLKPRLIPLMWLWFVASMLFTMFGPLLDLPGWMMNISAFEHLASYPAEDVDAVPLVVMTAAALVATAGALLGFRRRDLTTA